MLYIGHKQCWAVLDSILKAFEAGGYNRLVPYGQGGSVMMDSNPAPMYVPGVKGKKETGVEYTPNANGTPINIYFVDKDPATEKQLIGANYAKKCGADLRDHHGRIVSMRRCKNGNIQLMYIDYMRDDVTGKIITDKIALGSISVNESPVVKDGKQNSSIIVAMAFDQTIGLPLYQLKSIGDTLQAELYGIPKLEPREQVINTLAVRAGRYARRPGLRRKTRGVEKKVAKLTISGKQAKKAREAK